MSCQTRGSSSQEGLPFINTYTLVACRATVEHDPILCFAVLVCLSVCVCVCRAMLETLLREMDEDGGDDGGETVVHDNDQVKVCVSVKQQERTKKEEKKRRKQDCCCCQSRLHDKRAP